MAKEIQKSNFPKLEQFIKEILGRLATDWPKIIGQGANMTFKSFECLLFKEFKKIINDKTLLLEYEMSGERSGKMHLNVQFRDAVIIGGSILMEEEDDIKKSFSDSQMSEDYMDAFDEFGNQTAASFETIYRNHFPDEDDNHVRFIRSYTVPIGKEKLGEIFSTEDEDEILITRTQCSIWTFGKGEINLLFTSEVAEGMFNEIVTASTKKAFANIIYVDTNKKDISSVKKMLRNTEYYLHICTDADAAIAKLQHEKIDLVIIDTEFGEADGEGLSLCIRIKRNMLLDIVPVIMTSSNATKKIVLDCVRIGASDFLVKPFDKGHLFLKLEKLIKRKKFVK